MCVIVFAVAVPVNVGAEEPEFPGEPYEPWNWEENGWSIEETNSTIYIKSDGSIYPSTAPISRDGDIYTLTGNIYESIFIQKSDITLDGNGYTVQGSPPYWTGYGIYLNGKSGVIIKNINIEGFSYGIYLYSSPSTMVTNNNFSNNFCGICLHSSSDNITKNNFSNNYYGIWLHESGSNIIANNSISNGVYGIYLFKSILNTITNNSIYLNDVYGILLNSSDSNTIANNSISNHVFWGIFLSNDSKYNRIYGNNITATNLWGIYLSYSSNNVIYHNNIIDNTIQAYDTNPSNNNWHHPVLLEGNYWSDYTGLDDGSGTDKHAIVGDGIGDTEIPHPGLGYDFYPFVRKSGWEIIHATIDIDPNTLNLKSQGKWITAYIELAKDYDVADINVSTVRISKIGDTKLENPIYAEKHPTEIGDYDDDGIPDLMVKFDRAAVINAILNLGVSSGAEVELTVTGELYDGTLFEGTDTIKVIDRGKK